MSVSKSEQPFILAMICFSRNLSQGTKVRNCTQSLSFNAEMIEYVASRISRFDRYNQYAEQFRVTYTCKRSFIWPATSQLKIFKEISAPFVAMKTLTDREISS